MTISLTILSKQVSSKRIGSYDITDAILLVRQGELYGDGTPTNGRCCFIDECSHKAVCPNAGSLYRDSCGDKFKLTHDCKRYLKEKKKENECCFFDSCKRQFTCRFKGGTFSCNGRFKINDSCELISFESTIPPTTTTPTTTTTTTTSTTSRKREKCCFVDACNENIICGDNGHVLQTSCGNSFKIGRNCELTLEDEHSNDDCCYKDACNNNEICGSKKTILTDSCKISYLIEPDCKLTRQIGIMMDNTKNIESKGQCCFVDSCNGNKICGYRGAFLQDSCNIVYDVEDNCSLRLRTFNL